MIRGRGFQLQFTKLSVNWALALPPWQASHIARFPPSPRTEPRLKGHWLDPKRSQLVLDGGCLQSHLQFLVKFATISAGWLGTKTPIQNV